MKKLFNVVEIRNNTSCPWTDQTKSVKGKYVGTIYVIVPARASDLIQDSNCNVDHRQWISFSSDLMLFDCNFEIFFHVIFLYNGINHVESIGIRQI